MYRQVIPFQDDGEEVDAKYGLQGLLVSPKQSSHDIALEYANADPAFATKTAVSLYSALIAS
jgi:hypothetical protein